MFNWFKKKKEKEKSKQKSELKYWIKGNSKASLEIELEDFSYETSLHNVNYKVSFENAHLLKGHFKIFADVHLESFYEIKEKKEGRLGETITKAYKKYTEMMFLEDVYVGCDYFDFFAKEMARKINLKLKKGDSIKYFEPDYRDLEGFLDYQAESLFKKGFDYYKALQKEIASKFDDHLIH